MSLIEDRHIQKSLRETLFGLSNERIKKIVSDTNTEDLLRLIATENDINLQESAVNELEERIINSPIIDKDNKEMIIKPH